MFFVFWNGKADFMKGEQDLMKADYKKLQNGSDIRGVALEGIEGEKVNLGKTEAAALTS